MSERFNEDGTFIPYGANQGNVSGEIARYRDIFLTAEKDYVVKLLEDENIQSYFQDNLVNADSEALFEEFKKIESQLEFGELETPEERKQMENMSPEERDDFHSRKLSVAEGKMVLLMAAIRDKELIKELVLINNQSEEKENGRSRGRR